MIEKYVTLTKVINEIEIERSRFITHVEPIIDEENANRILKNLSKTYYDSTHICYGFISDIDGNIQRYSDDGEPQGTAGIPILEVIKSNNYRQSLVAVVRYFGGIKLGAGGLVRAYSKSASLAIEQSTKITHVLSDIYRIKLDYSTHKKISKIFVNTLCKIINLEYNDNIIITLSTYSDSDFIKTIIESSSGRAQIDKIETKYIIY